MPAKDLKADIKANLEGLEPIIKVLGEVKEGDAPLTPRASALLALATHLKDSLWPFLDGIADELAQHEESWQELGPDLAELEEAVDELTEERGTVLMPDEAGVFSLLVKLTRDACAKLEKGAALTSDEIGALRLACDASEKVITDNVINVDVDDDDADDEGDDDDAADD
jgi:hypothetical protein